MHYVKSPRFLFGGPTDIACRTGCARSGDERPGTSAWRMRPAAYLNAATRKYLTADHLWYYPPVEAFVKLAEYANRFGKPEGRPYFSLDGKEAIRAGEWAKMRGSSAVRWGSRTSGGNRKSPAQERIQGPERHEVQVPQPPRKPEALAVHRAGDLRPRPIKGTWCGSRSGALSRCGRLPSLGRAYCARGDRPRVLFRGHRKSWQIMSRKEN